MNYPGVVLGTSSEGPAAEAVAPRIRMALRAYGYQVAETGPYDEELAAAVRLFQARHVDSSGRPLKVDGEVGPNTWSSLFADGAGLVELDHVLQVAAGEIGVREDPPNSNCGPRVEVYLRAAGAAPGDARCMSFVYWCFRTAVHGADCPVPRSAGVLDVYRKVKDASPSRIIGKAEVIANPVLVKPGLVFIYDFSGGHGHTGFVKRLEGGALMTIEGNTNNGATREGDGVYELNRRSITDDHLVSLIDFSK